MSSKEEGPFAGSGTTPIQIAHLIRMRILDLFCGAGGAAMGLHRVWLNAQIVGVDIVPQPNYPFQFVQASVLELPFLLSSFDFIWASPPCQHYSQALNCRPGVRDKHPDLVAPVRDMLVESRLPYAIENVPKAPLLNPVVLCGLSFGLKVFRHRLFETSFPVVAPTHPKHNKGATVRGEMFSVFGHFGGGHRYYTKRNGEEVAFKRGTLEQWRDAMGIDWMDRKELAQAIPPAYSEYIARQLK
jgi:DNA (cytosine-5)-methyltransferase 1